MGHIPRKYTNAGKRDARIAGDAKAARLAIKRLQDQMKALKQQKAQPAPAPTPPPAAPAPAPPPQPKAGTFKVSPEIQQAKDRVNSYENKSKNQKSPWEQAQANVQSSFIKPSSSSPQQQYDFGSNSFDANESSKPNEQAQAAQSNFQNSMSKYSQYKSNN